MTMPVVAGVGITQFGKFQELTLKDLVAEAVTEALKDAEISPSEVGAAFGSNSLAGLLTGQESVRTQTVLAPLGIRGVPMASVENACASGSTAFKMAVDAVRYGEARYALAVGFEKMSHPDKQKTFDAIGTARDLDESDPSVAGHSAFMDLYAEEVRSYMRRYGATAEDFALVTVKNHRHGTLNPRAQYRYEVTVEDVLTSRVVAEPLTMLMCSPIGDGAAAVVVTSSGHSSRSPRVAASIVRSGAVDPTSDNNDVTQTARAAYEAAGLTPSDVDVAEVHDAAAPAELIAYEDLLLAPRGEAAKWLRDGVSSLGGRVPVNTSGGLESRGHPIGATGVAMIVEMVLQLRGEAGARQAGQPRVALVQNSGGWVAGAPAASAVHLLTTS